MGSWQTSSSTFWGNSSKYPGIDDIFISTSGPSNLRLLPPPPIPNTSRIVKASHLCVNLKKKKNPGTILRKFTYGMQHSKLIYSHTRHTLAQTADYVPPLRGLPATITVLSLCELQSLRKQNYRLSFTTSGTVCCWYNISLFSFAITLHKTRTWTWNFYSSEAPQFPPRGAEWAE